MNNNTTTNATWDNGWVNPDWTEATIAEAEAAKAKKAAIAKIAAVSGLGAGIGVLGILGAMRAAKKKGESHDEDVEVLDGGEIVNPDGTLANETAATAEDREALAKKIREQAETKDDDPERDKFIENLRGVIDNALDDELVRTIAEAAWAAGSATAHSKAADDIIAIAAERDRLTNAADAERNAAAEKLNEQTRRADAATTRLKAVANENKILRKDLEELKAAERARAEAEAVTAEKNLGDETVKDKTESVENTEETAEEDRPTTADDVDDDDGELPPIDKKTLESIQRAAAKNRGKSGKKAAKKRKKRK